MSSRLGLIAVSARNTIGRAVGATSAYTPAQIAVAQYIFNFWVVRGCDEMTAAAFVGCVDGECSFLINARGDRDTAGGIGQWHQPRRGLILQYAGHDVWSPILVEQLAGQLAEITPCTTNKQWSSYRSVLAHVQAAPDMTSKVRVLVHEFEQSGSQDRDVARRTPMANYWLTQFGKAAA